MARSFKYTYSCPQCDTAVQFTITPPTAARISGPPEKCDPGDAGEVEGPSNCTSCSYPLDADVILEAALMDAEERAEDYLPDYDDEI